MPYVDNIVNFLGFGSVESLLEAHAKNSAGASQSDVSLAFLIIGLVYMVAMPISGYVRRIFAVLWLLTVVSKIFPFPRHVSG